MVPDFFVVKVDAIKTFSFGEGDPSLNGGFGFTEVFSDVSEACTGSMGGNYLVAFLGNGGVIFLCVMGKIGWKKECQKCF